MNGLRPDEYKNIVVLTGAGISVSAGLSPYRGPGGLWNNADVVKFSSVDSLADPEQLWKFWIAVRKKILDCQPTKAHLTLAELEKRLPEARVTIVTQNIDRLHHRAGSENVIEYHGCSLRSRCMDQKCSSEAFDDSSIEDAVPACRHCQSPLRPDIVLFGEEIPAEAEWKTRRVLRDCDLFIAIGTSGMVAPASGFVMSAKYAGARTVLINLEPMEQPNPAFDQELLGEADDLVPRLLG